MKLVDTPKRLDLAARRFHQVGRGGRRRDAKFSLRTYNYTEITSLLAAAKFAIKNMFSDWQASPFDALSKKVVIIAQKQ